MNASLPIYRHKKTQGLYQILQEWALLEQDKTPCVVYRSIDEGTVWVRPYSEFFDGRFEELKDQGS